MSVDQFHASLRSWEPAALASRWQTLEAKGKSSFFLGWTWTGAWLAATGVRPDLLAVQVDGRDMAFALVGRARMQRPLGKLPGLSLNQSGDAAADRHFVEYNGFLVAQDAPGGVEQAAVEHLLACRDWRLLRLSGVVSGSPLADAGTFRRRTLIAETPAYFVDLEGVRLAQGDYLSLLSANSRSQIRRSIREYGAGEPEIAIAVADDIEQWLSEMRALNTGRHADNAWEEPLFRSFAHELVIRGLANGEVELLRITQGGRLLGYLLNFVYRDRAMNYQSAFASGISPKAKPGLMCHAAAVARYAAGGHAIYSLLAGEDRYKQSLSTGHETLQWWELERFSPSLEAEYMLRKIFRRPVFG